MKIRQFSVCVIICVAAFIFGISANGFGETNVSALTKASANDIQAQINTIERSLGNQDNWLKAKNEYQQLLALHLPRKTRKQIESALGNLNIKILFSTILTPDSFTYTIQPGDSLFVLARKNHTTVDLIKKANRLSLDTIQTGRKLKITKATFRIHVSKSKNTLGLFNGSELIKTYRVATGRKNSTPVGVFTIENKLENPVWYKDGVAYQPSDPKNILGTRWLGFSLEHYGIHGTTLPKTIGTQASDGCVRMLNADVEELYTIVPLKTQVTVVN